MEIKLTTLVALLSELRDLGIPEEKLPLDELKEQIPRMPFFTIAIDLEQSSEHTYTIELGYTVKESNLPKLDYYNACLIGRPYAGLQRSHRFDFARTRFTVVEARNLLLGRAVYKLCYKGQSDEFAAWFTLLRNDCNAEAQFREMVFNATYRPSLERLLSIPKIVEMEQSNLAEELILRVKAGDLLLIGVREGATAITPKVLEFDPGRWIVKILPYKKKYLLSPSNYIIKLSNDFPQRHDQ